MDATDVRFDEMARLPAPPGGATQRSLAEGQTFDPVETPGEQQSVEQFNAIAERLKALQQQLDDVPTSGVGRNMPLARRLRAKIRMARAEQAALTQLEQGRTLDPPESLAERQQEIQYEQEEYYRSADPYEIVAREREERLRGEEQAQADPSYDATHAAGGFWQITNTTWNRYKHEAGADMYSRAIDAPLEVQRRVAQAIYAKEGYAPWADYNPALRAALQKGGVPSKLIGNIDPTSGAGQQFHQQAVGGYASWQIALRALYQNNPGVPGHVLWNALIDLQGVMSTDSQMQMDRMKRELDIANLEREAAIVSEPLKTDLMNQANSMRDHRQLMYDMPLPDPGPQPTLSQTPIAPPPPPAARPSPPPAAWRGLEKSKKVAGGWFLPTIMLYFLTLVGGGWYAFDGRVTLPPAYTPPSAPTAPYTASSRVPAPTPRHSDSVPIYFANGDGGAWVDVGLGSTTRRMLIDTGADVMGLPADIAEQLVRSGEARWGDQSWITMADGSSHEEWTITIYRVTIGSHTLTNVEAGVAPTNSQPLLPLPVLQEIGPFTIDLQAGLLTLGRGPLPGTTP
jgi:hypothetical protein